MLKDGGIKICSTQTVLLDGRLLHYGQLLRIFAQIEAMRL